MTITGIRSPLDVPTQHTIRVQSPLAADWSDANYKIADFDTNKPAFDDVKDIYEFRMKQDDFVHTLRNLPVDLHCLDTRAGDIQTRFVNSKIRAIDHSTKGSVRPVQPGMCWLFDNSSYVSRAITSHNSYPFTIAVRFFVRDTSGVHSLVSLAQSAIRYMYVGLDSTNMRFTRRNPSSLSTNIATFTVNQWTDIIVRFDNSTTVTTWHRFYNNNWGEWIKQTFADLTSVDIPSLDSITVGANNNFTAGQFFDGFISRASYMPKAVNEPSNNFPLATKNDGTSSVCYVCETSGALLDISGNNFTAVTGSINNLSSFYNQTGINDVESWSNVVGYTLSDGSTYFSDASINDLIPSGSIISRNELSRSKAAAYTTRNVLANLQFTGRVPHDPVIFGPCGTFDGTADVVELGNILANITGLFTYIKLDTDNQTILTLDNSTDGSITVSGGVLNFGSNIATGNILVDGDLSTATAAGASLNNNLWHSLLCNLTAISGSNVRLGTNGVAFGNIELAGFKINNGITANLPFTEVSSGIIHDTSSNANYGVLTTTDTVAFWANKQDKFDYLVTNGGRWVRTFDGVDDQLNVPQSGKSLSLSATSVSIRLLSINDNQPLFTLSNSTGTSVFVSGDTLHFGGALDASNIKVDNVEKTAAQAGALINDQTWHIITFDNTTTATNIRLGTDSDLFGQIYVSEFRVGDSTWDLTKTGPIAPDTSSLLNHGSYSGTTGVLVPGDVAGVISQGQGGLCRQTSDGLYGNFLRNVHYFNNNTRLTTGRVRKMSVGAWFQPTLQGLQMAVAGEYTTTANQRAWVVLSQGVSVTNWRVILTGSGNFTTHRKDYISTENIDNGGWHHVAFTYDGAVTPSGELLLYQDGLLVTPTKTIDETCTGLFDTTAPFSIGAINVDGTPGFMMSGDISQVVVHEGIVWSLAQISGLYIGTVPAEAKAWNFTETQGTGVTSSNGPTLQLTGSSTDLWASNLAKSVMHLELADEPFSPYGLAISGNRDSTIYRAGDNAIDNDSLMSVAARVNTNDDDRLIVYRDQLSFNKTKILDYTK